MIITDQYSAGFFDGEGSVRLKKEPNGLYSSIHMQIGQKTDLTLSLLQQKYGGTVSKLQGLASRSNRPAGYNWGLYGEVAYSFLKAIEPYSVEKHEQIMIVIDYWDTKSRNGQFVTIAEFQYRRSIADRLSNLKHGVTTVG